MANGSSQSCEAGFESLNLACSTQRVQEQNMTNCFPTYRHKRVGGAKGDGVGVLINDLQFRRVPKLICQHSGVC